MSRSTQPRHYDDEQFGAEIQRLTVQIVEAVIQKEIAAGLANAAQDMARQLAGSLQHAPARSQKVRSTRAAKQKLAKAPKKSAKGGAMRKGKGAKAPKKGGAVRKREVAKTSRTSAKGGTAKDAKRRTRGK